MVNGGRKNSFLQFTIYYSLFTCLHSVNFFYYFLKPCGVCEHSHVIEEDVGCSVGREHFGEFFEFVRFVDVAATASTMQAEVAEFRCDRACGERINHVSQIEFVA